jgi:CRISPR/Cas system-associated endonuclease Cas1
VAAFSKSSPLASQPGLTLVHIIANPTPLSSRGGGSFSIAACRFCIDHRITVLSTSWLVDLTTFVAPRPIQDAALLRLQCVARPAPIAREIVIQKFRHYLATRRLTQPQFHDFETRLNRAHKLDAILGIEATGSSLSWAYWSGLQLMPRSQVPLKKAKALSCASNTISWVSHG